ncbi:MAG: DUF4302 domain-containing protein [Prevotella sp.]|nr:DUF4302 domain-containing protein [Prevotella sp.]
MKIFKYLLLAGVAMIVASCVKDEEDLFSESAAQRINTAVEDYTKLLESSEKGWVMNFYPAHDGEMGGVVYTARFSDGTVALRCQETPGEDEVKSLYQVKGEQEILLTFDTYTEIFHQYSEPINSTYPTGYESDYEFTFKGVSADQDTIFLKGKRYSQPLELIRLHDEEPADYISQIATMYNQIAMLPHPIAVINDTETIDISLADGVFYFAEYVDAPTDWDAENKDFVEHYIPFITTLKGLKMQEPVTIAGETFQECVYNSEDRSLTAVGANVVFPVILPEGYTEYEEYEGSYTMYVRNGAVSFPITLKPDGDGSNYTITGMSSYFDVKAKYNAAKGCLEIHSQQVGEYGGNLVWLCCWDIAGGGSLTWSTTAAVDLQRDLDEETLTFNFVANNDYDADFNADSFILWSTTSAGSSAGQFTTWRFNGVNSNQMRNLQRIVKNN